MLYRNHPLFGYSAYVNEEPISLVTVNWIGISEFRAYTVELVKFSKIEIVSASGKKCGTCP
jgi:hypothetical protein